MPAAPDSEVAVPTTTAPRAASSWAMALPMPRAAPVTSATFPCNSFSCMRSPLKKVKCRLHGSRVGDGQADEILVDALGQAVQHLARTAFDDVGHTLRLHCLDGFHPTHRVPGLTHQRVADAGRVGHHGNIDVVDDGNRGH